MVHETTDSNGGTSSNGLTDISEFEQNLRQLCPVDDNEGKCAADDPVLRSKRALDNVAFHDFAFYEYLLPTERGYLNSSRSDLSAKGLEYIDQLEQNGVPDEQLELLVIFLVQLEEMLRKALIVSVNPNLNSEQVLQLLIEGLYDQYSWVISNLFIRFIEDRDSGRGEEFLRDLYTLFRIQFLIDRHQPVYLLNWWDSWARGPYERYQSQRGWMWPTPGDAQELFKRQWDRFDAGTFDDYPFEVFPNYSVNIGLRLLYRQEWKPLAVQPGEIVRTIPLGPGQKERVTTKIIRRSKRTSTMETVTETETTTESTDSTKDSNEIVAEAASNFNWKVDAEVHGGISLIGGSVNTSFGGSSEDKSKRTSSHLSESMQKAASKVRRETKIVVSTETEETFEREQLSEITNPNNEMAITYEYLKLQQQYEVFTYLAEVQSVIFVAENLPAPSEINEDWIRQHDWIIAKSLKDESHWETLNELIQDVDDVDSHVDEAGEAEFANMMKAAQNQFAVFDPKQQGGVSLPDIYAEPQRIYRDHIKEKEDRGRANELRTIKRERLKNHIRDNILHYCQAIWSHEDPEQRFLRYKKEDRRVPVEWGRPPILRIGQPARLAPTGKDAPLWELIDPTGPLGYIGNYAVFGLRPLPQQDLPDASGLFPEEFFARNIRNVSLESLMAELREDYIDDDGTLLDPALAAYAEEARELVRDEPDVLKRLNDPRVLDFLSYQPHLWDEYVDDAGDIKRDPTDPISPRQLQRQITTDEWGQYLYRKNGTRRFLVDSNNLYLNIRTGDGAALEPFKRAHRYIDVLKAQEELGSMKRKNQRRSTHMNQSGEYDPDIEKVVIVGDESLIANHAAFHEAMGSSETLGTGSDGIPEVTNVSAGSDGDRGEVVPE